MKQLFAVLYLLVVSQRLVGQSLIWQPSPGHQQIAIWPGTAPDQQPVEGPEFAKLSEANDLVAGRQVLEVDNVTRPTMTIYSPQGRSTGEAVVVFPGGGYKILAIDLEGAEVCDWLTTKGITCVLLKYRVTSVGPYPKSGPYPESPMALEDAQRTMGLVRLHAAEWHINPHKVGVLGFSAGGHLVAAISNHFASRLYVRVDAADQQSCRPDFAVAIYPGHLSLATAQWDATQGTKPFSSPDLERSRGSENPLALNPDLHITRQTPPTFLLQNENDKVDGVEQALTYYIALKNAEVPVEMHLYAQGGHAFGLRRSQMPATAWPELVEPCLRTIGTAP
jgi:acetyl esterase/lipase